ncbi:DNA methylase [Bacteroidales bacterium Barb4]|nr:DNA methylase [Bacteroidales bacterium Barb4]
MPTPCGIVGITLARFLDPSAGNGAFADAFKQAFPNSETACFEKDLLTGKILSYLYPDDKVHIKGFEEIENRPSNRFDVVSFNISFGDVAVFDIAFFKGNDIVRRQASHIISFSKEWMCFGKVGYRHSSLHKE